MSNRRNRPPSGKSNVFKAKNDLVLSSNWSPSPSKFNISTTFDGQESSNRKSARPMSAGSGHLMVSGDGRPMSARESRLVSPTNQASVTFMSRPQSATVRSNSQSKSSLFVSPRNGGICSASPRKDGTGSSRRVENDDCDISEFLNLSKEEIIARMREKGDIEAREQISRDTLLMSEYNAFSRPKPSLAYPLRTCLLDPEVNNFPPSRTRSELMKKIKISSMPHPSYDIDGDGYVSMDDYRLSKRFDFDGNGVIDPDERGVAKHVVAEEFFMSHKDELQLFGDQIAKTSIADNISKLEHSGSFERTLSRLKGVEESLKGRSSKVMVACMNSSNPRLTKHNFYSNQFDTTAYSNFEAIPYQRGSTLQHNGSQRALMLQRREAMQREASEKFEKVVSKQPKYRTAKISLISNYALEN